MQSRSGAPTLEAVARLAGVSRATVSRVVNGSPKVTPDVLAKVRSAIEELGYVPNRAARSLASSRTQAIALVVPEDTAKVFDEPYFSQIVQGVATHLASTDYALSLLISSAGSTEKTRRYLLGGNVDGAVVVSHHRDDPLLEGVAGTLPLVFGGRPFEPVPSLTHYVDADNVGGARAAVEHLVRLGRSRIATIAGPEDMTAGQDRLRGWQEALAAAGLHADLAERGDFSPASGAKAMRSLLATGAPIDGLFAANDQMALGAYAVLAEHGLRIPEDVAVVGFDDDRAAATAIPPLTSVAQPSVEMGAEMARLLIQLIEGAGSVPEATVMPTELQVRASSARPLKLSA
ncbi:MAG: LacI family transcriptional regulator [Arthrobacter sp.]|jgi:LacI family transcriptional regulator|nr:LacI family transcriptional regulator [Arthrobacter sp.]